MPATDRAPGTFDPFSDALDAIESNTRSLATLATWNDRIGREVAELHRELSAVREELRHAVTVLGNRIEAATRTPRTTMSSTAYGVRFCGLEADHPCHLWDVQTTGATYRCHGYGL